MFEQLPPHDIQAEESVVASLMVDDEAIHKIIPIVKPSDFFRETNAWTYEACMALSDRGETINQVTVAHELDRRGHLEDVGGHTFLSELVLNLPTSVGVEHYAAIVRRDAVYRQMLGVATNIAQIAFQGGADLETSLAKAESMVYGLRGGEASRDFTHISEYLGPFLDPPDAEDSMPYGGHVRTGLSDLDHMLGGLNPSDLLIVAARTGVGKTALMLNFARNAAIGSHAKVAVFSLEMAGEQLAQRLLAAESRVNSAHLRLGMHNEAGGEPDHARPRRPRGRRDLGRRHGDDPDPGAARQAHAPAARARPRPRACWITSSSFRAAATTTACRRSAPSHAPSSSWPES